MEKSPAPVGRRLPQELSPAAKYAAAIAFALVAIGLRAALDPWLGTRIPFVAAVAAVAASVWVSGYVPAVLTMLIGFVAGDWLFDESRGVIGLDAVNFVTFVTYFVSCSVIIGFGVSLRRAQRHLQVPRDELQSIFDAAPVAILVAHDPECKSVTGNRFAYEMLGLREGNISRTAPPGERMSYRILRNGKEVPGSELPLQRAAAEGEPVREQEMEFAFEGRPSVHVTGSAAPLRDAEGNVRGAIAVYSDITQRKRAEELLRLITDNIPALIAYVDTDFRYRLNNRVYGAWFGEDQADVSGKLVSEVLGAAGWEKVRPYMETALAGKPVSFETEIGDARAGNRWVGASYVPHFGPSGTVEGLALFANDLTGRHTAEAALREADRRKDEFLATLAHELRNPLAPIRSAVEIVQRLSPGDERLRGPLEIADRQIRHMTRLVDDLLDVARITRGKIRLRRQTIGLAGVLLDAVESARPLIEASGHVLDVTIAPEPIRVNADPTRLTQIVFNLLNNAAKFTPAGGHVWLNARREGNFALISVRDDGRGIAAEHLPSLFEMFSQVSPALERSEQGLGIGLALVRGLVELHGGRVSALSGGPGKGSEFVVRLPLSEAITQAASDSGSDADGTRSGPRRRILVVDDNRDAADSLGAILELMGHDVQVAYRGAEALRRSEAQRFDAVLLDIGMPDLNGYEVASRLRQLPQGENVILVALTGWGQEEDKRRAAGAGFDHHLTKPVEAAAVAALLRKTD